MRSPGSRRGGVLFGLMLSGLVVVCLMIAGTLYLARNIRVQTVAHSGGDSVLIDTPAGHLTVRTHEHGGAALADIPMYPGARVEDSGGGATVQWTSDNGETDKEFGVSASKSVTSDSLARVVDYYKAQLPNWMVVAEKHGGVRLEFSEGGYKRFIVVHEENDGTHIAVASVGEPASN
jgi:hypothetical protein